MQTATIQQINSSIMFGTFTNEQLDSIMCAVKYARAQLGKEIKRSLSRGDSVKFYSSKRGTTVFGTVEKVAIKYVTIRANNGLWKVPANMLEAA